MTIVCAYHGWSYDADGKCIRIPSIPPEHPIPKKACLTRYLTQERSQLPCCDRSGQLSPIGIISHPENCDEP